MLNETVRGFRTKEAPRYCYVTKDIVKDLKERYKAEREIPDFIKMLEKVGNEFSEISMWEVYQGKLTKSGQDLEIFLEDMAQVVDGEIRNVKVKNARCCDQHMEGGNVYCTDYYQDVDGEFWENLAKSKIAIATDGKNVLVGCLGRNIEEGKAIRQLVRKSIFIKEVGHKMGGVVKLSRKHCEKFREKYLKSYSCEGKNKLEEWQIKETLDKIETEKEMELRKQVSDFGKEMYCSGLVQGTWGNLSVRLGNDFMLVSPSGVRYQNVNVEDVVKVSINDLSYESFRKPTSEMIMHAEIYKKRPDINAVVHFHGTYTGVFAACEKPMKDYPVTKYEIAGSVELAREVSEAIKDNDGIILAHHGAIFVAQNLAEAVEGAKTMEEKALKEIENI